ncbi:MAG: GNAT family N-acetyltransferase [Pseudomonadota bacterium]
MPKDLKTERMTLRSLRPSDAGLMTLYLSDDRVAKMLALVPFPYPPGAAEAYIEKILAGQHPTEVWAMDATQIGSSELVGLVSFKPEQRSLHYWVGPPFWNTGMASEAVEAVAHHLLEDRGVPELIASIFIDNPASEQVLRKLGFTPSRDHEAFCVARDQTVAVRDYALTLSALRSAGHSATTA